MKRLFLAVMLLCLCAGFRVYSKTKPWSRISRDTTTTQKLFVVFERGSDELEDDLPSGDVLSGTTITVATAIASVLDDYNDIEASYITLVDSTDPDYVANSENRTINIKNAAAGGTSGGEAKFTSNGEEVTGCVISLEDNAYDKGKNFVGLVTHELGHCLGMDHPQEHTHSIMSYFKYDSTYRLQSDDKMAMIYLYPTDPDKAKEDPTFGLQCQRRE